MTRSLLLACGLLSLAASPVFARGVSPYLPLNLDPVVEWQIEQVLLLADKPVLTRPIAAATVLDALPTACRRDPALCQSVRRYLSRYMRNWSVTEASVEVSASGDTDKTLPNRYGLTTASNWNASIEGFWQPLDHALVSLGAVAYQGEVVPQGSMVSLGWDRAQFDLGYRARWLSPLSDSSMLVSTEAATMPSVTLSNYAPLTRWGIHYEAFVASMSESDKILFDGEPQRGHPRLAGLHLSTEPASGWALGVNRLIQYGGGQRPGSFKDLLRAFFDPARYDNTRADLSLDEQFGNQIASFTSSLIFPGRVPFSVYFEYAGEDTSAGKNYLLGNSSLSAGIHFPRLWRRFDLSLEMSEWQNFWYVNAVYGDGLTNKGHVIGHWGGDERQPTAAPGARAGTVRLGWNAPFGGRVDARARVLQNQDYYGPYETGYDGTLSYSRPIGLFSVGAEIYAGKDVFGERFSRVGAFVRLDDWPGERTNYFASDDSFAWPANKSAEMFVDAGAAMNRVNIDLDPALPKTTTSGGGAHVALGVRRGVSDRSDLGARVELDDVEGHTLLSVRAIDYRYRFQNPLALSVFVGASRYDLATPAFGLYFGAGLQWRNVLPGWDVGFDLRRAEKVARDHLLPSDPQNPVRPDSFYSISSASLSLTKRF